VIKETKIEDTFMHKKELAVLGEMINKKYIIAVAINRGS
jgi:hypothetical protein